MSIQPLVAVTLCRCAGPAGPAHRKELCATLVIDQETLHDARPTKYKKCIYVFCMILTSTTISQPASTVFVTETDCVTCEVRTELLYTSMNARLQGGKSGCLGSIRKRGDTNMRSLHLQCLSRKYHRQFVLCEMTFPAIIHSTANSLHNLSRKTISARP